MSNRDMPLSFASPGTGLIVTGVHAGSGLRQRLVDMGLVPGERVTIISGCHPGPLVVEVKGSRLGLGFGVAQKVMVKEAADESTADSGCADRQPQLR